MAPLYPTRDAALNAPGRVYLHFKGGVYRLLTYVRAAEPLPDVERLTETWEGGRPAEDLVIYEHLWPHGHQHYVRPAAEFFDHEADRRAALGPVEGQLGRRFTPYSGGRPDVARLTGGFDHECLRSR